MSITASRKQKGYPINKDSPFLMDLRRFNALKNL